MFAPQDITTPAKLFAALPSRYAAEVKNCLEPWTRVASREWRMTDLLLPPKDFDDAVQARYRKAISVALGRRIERLHVISNRRNPRNLTWMDDPEQPREEYEKRESLFVRNDFHAFSDSLHSAIGGYVRAYRLGEDHSSLVVSAYDHALGNELGAAFRGTLWRGFEDQVWWGVREYHLCLLLTAWADMRTEFDRLTPLVPLIYRAPIFAESPTEPQTLICFNA